MLASGIYSKIQDQTSNKLNPTGQGGGGGGGEPKVPALILTFENFLAI